MANENKNNMWMIGIILLVVITTFNSSVMSNEVLPGELTPWQTSYQSSVPLLLDSYADDIADTLYYDIHNPIIEAAAEEIRASSKDSMDAVKKTLKYVYDNVEYVYGESDEACFNGKAPQILAGKKGQCDTQSIVVISILRNLGIASKGVGGCVLPSRCALQSIFIEEIPTLTNPAQYEDLDPEEDVFSRGANLRSREGGLHAWAEAYIPGEGWVQLEPTRGTLANLGCYGYHIELFPRDDQKDLLCVSKNYDYALSCRNNNLEGLNANGIGLVTEVQQ